MFIIFLERLKVGFVVKIKIHTRLLAACLSSLAIALMVTTAGSVTFICMITLISEDWSGMQRGAYQPSISADGRYVAYETRVSNVLVGGDTRYEPVISVHDALTGATKPVSVDLSGKPAIGVVPSISADGRYVAFLSPATNLVSGDTNGFYDIFVRDRLTDTTRLASVNSSGVQANGDSDDLCISADGRYVAFQSQASNLVSGGVKNYFWNVYVHDMQSGATTLVSADTNGVYDKFGDSYSPSISATGRYVAFQSTSSHLVSEDTGNAAWDIFVRDTLTGTTMLISMDSNGVQGNGDSYRPSISADGRYVAFYSHASNLVSGDTNGYADIFVRDTHAGTTTRLSVDSDGVQGNGDSFLSSISGDGLYVAFYSQASNLVSGDTNGYADIFVRNIRAGTTTRLSVDSYGEQGNSSDSISPSISANGRYVAFASGASDLVRGDNNNEWDVFVVPASEEFSDLTRR